MTEDKYKDYLFSNSRLSVRLLIMEKYSVPILKQMSSKDSSYHHFITYSTDLPDFFKDSLFKLVEGSDNLHVVEHTSLLTKIKSIIRLNAQSPSGAYAIFNLDDDDLVAKDYISNLREYVDPKFSGWAISFGLGISTLFDNETGEFYDFRECYHPKINIGLALVNSYEISRENVDIGSLSRPSHTIIDKKKKLALDSSNVMWAWARHIDQDTLINKDAMKVLKAKQEKMNLMPNSVFKDRFTVI
jgi:hypothetical protein